MKRVQTLGVPLVIVGAALLFVWQVNDRYRSDLDTIRTELQSIRSALSNLVSRVDAESAAQESGSINDYTRADRYVECLLEKDGADEQSCERIIYTPAFSVTRLHFPPIWNGVGGR